MQLGIAILIFDYDKNLENKIKKDLRIYSSRFNVQRSRFKIINYEN